jgi:5-methylcytosine-specific restriction endonuclease McrA
MKANPIVLSIEHRIPLSRGGSNWPANLAPACKTCNSSKGTKTEKEYRELLRLKRVNVN